jgi:phosphate transport system protein
MVVDIRKNFHQELDAIRDDIIRMAGMVTEAMASATQALLAGDLEAADAIIEGDDAIDALALDIEERCYQLLALQQPMASDLRSIITAIRLIAEIERSGDLVANIMKGSRRIYGTEFDPRIRGKIDRFGEQAHRLFRLSIDAYADGNASLAAAMNDMDDVVDDLHVEYIQSIFEGHERQEMSLQCAVQLALIGRFYERIGDHAVNIGERVRYMVTGWLPEQTGAARHASKLAGAATPAGPDGQIADDHDRDSPDGPAEDHA